MTIVWNCSYRAFYVCFVILVWKLCRVDIHYANCCSLQVQIVQFLHLPAMTWNFSVHKQTTVITIKCILCCCFFFDFQTHLQQLQQLQQLQALLLQHIANEASASATSVATGSSANTTTGTADSVEMVGGSGVEGTTAEVPTIKSEGTRTVATETALQVSITALI